MIIREVARPTFFDLFGLTSSKSAGQILGNIELVGSGKGALALILKYLTQQGILKNKTDEILVPDWLGYWVYNQMQPFAFPAKRWSERTKAIFVYHQYGFPQDMEKIMTFAKEKNLVVIEDCAHAVASQYKGQPLGSFGDFAIFSFSKWFFCFALGGIKSRSAEFISYVREETARTPFGLTAFKDLTKYWAESQVFGRYANLFLKMSYAIYGDALKASSFARRLLIGKLDQEVAVRQRRYQYFIQATEHLDICDHLEKEHVTPYVIPIRLPPGKEERVVRALLEKGIESGIYQFDLNRNLLEPKFVPTVWIPCHSGISDKTFELITETVSKSYA